MQELLTTMRTRNILAAVTCALALASAPAVVLAGDDSEQAAGPSSDDIAKAKDHFIKGKELFDKKNYKAAVAQFKQSYKLSKNPLLLYNIGFTLDQMGDKSMALFYYQKYLEGAPKTDANREAATERVKALEVEIEEASLAGTTDSSTDSSTGTTTEPADTPPAQPVVDKFQHNVIDEAPPGKPIDVSAFVPPNSNWQVTLFYRPAGESSFTTVQMRPRYNELIGRIPAKTTVGVSVQYYIEVRNAAGKVVDRSGRATSPHLIFLDEAAKPRFYADLGDETATPLERDEAFRQTGGGLEMTTSPSGDGWMDAGSSKFNKLKWGTTIGAGSLVVLSGTFFLLSSKAASDLEAEADESGDPSSCQGTPPCRAFSDRQQSLEGRGERFETLANVSLVIGGAAAIGAGVLWYMDMKDQKRRKKSRQSDNPDEPFLGAAPVIGQDFIGGAAAVRF